MPPGADIGPETVLPAGADNQGADTPPPVQCMLGDN